MHLNLKKMYFPLQMKVLIGVRVYWTAWAFLYTSLFSKYSMWNNKTRLKIEKCHTPRARKNSYLKKCIPKHLQSRGPQSDDEYFANLEGFESFSPIISTIWWLLPPSVREDWKFLILPGGRERSYGDGGCNWAGVILLPGPHKVTISRQGKRACQLSVAGGQSLWGTMSVAH